MFRFIRVPHSHLALLSEQQKYHSGNGTSRQLLSFSIATSPVTSGIIAPPSTSIPDTSHVAFSAYKREPFPPFMHLHRSQWAGSTLVLNTQPRNLYRSHISMRYLALPSSSPKRFVTSTIPVGRTAFASVVYCLFKVARRSSFLTSNSP